MSMEELKAIFAANLIRLRSAAGMTQAELGERLHYTDKAVSKWERAESLPDALVLKNMAELFQISVDELLRSRDEWTPRQSLRTEKETYSRLFIILCAIASIWTLCVVEFVIVWVLLDAIQWIVFVVAVPLSLVALLVFNSIWNHGRNNMYIIFLLVLSLVVLVYLLLLHYNFWQMFLVLAPAELVVFLACNIKKHRNHRDSTVRRAAETDSREETDSSSL